MLVQRVYFFSHKFAPKTRSTVLWIPPVGAGVWYQPPVGEPAVALATLALWRERRPLLNAAEAVLLKF